VRALRWHDRLDVRLDDVPDLGPEDCGDQELLLDVLWCGICGTDVEEWRTGPIFVPASGPHPLTGARAPLTLGHELVGRIVHRGRDVPPDTPVVGEVVAVDGLSSCGSCEGCRTGSAVLCDRLSAVGLMRDGGLADRVVVPAAGSIKVPPGLRADHAALAETAAVAVRGLRHAALTPGESVAVVGGGAVGLLTATVALASGASSVAVIEPLEQRRRAADRMGFGTLSPDEAARRIDATRDGLGVDVVVEASGTAAGAALSVPAVRRGGRVVVVGIHSRPAAVDLLSLVIGERRLIGSLSHDAAQDFAPALAILAAGGVDLDEVVSHRRPLTEALLAFDDLAHRSADHLKVLVTPAANPEDVLA
jgi:(R,R)-butanediol dehydrogenase/meso-butanediol dehydrogenase/diacetyl reductase